MPVALHFYPKHHNIYSYIPFFSEYVQVNCPDISKCKSWFPDKNSLFACMRTHSIFKIFTKQMVYQGFNSKKKQSLHIFIDFSHLTLSLKGKLKTCSVKSKVFLWT